MPSTVFQGITTNQLVNFCFHDTKAVRRRRWSGKWKACSGCQRRCQHLQLQPRSRGAQRCRGHMGGWGECFELGLSMASTNVYWRLLAYIPRNGRLILMKVMDLEEPRGTLFSDWSVLFKESFWSYDSWLVVWNMNFVTFHIIIGNNHSNWLIFFAGVETTNQIHMIWKNTGNMTATFHWCVALTKRRACEASGFCWYTIPWDMRLIVITVQTPPVHVLWLWSFLAELYPCD